MFFLPFLYILYILKSTYTTRTLINNAFCCVFTQTKCKQPNATKTATFSFPTFCCATACVRYVFKNTCIYVCTYVYV